MVINHLSHASGRRPVDLVNALRRQYAPDPLLASRVDFAAIGAAATAAGAWRGAPGVQTMLGPMQAAAKVRRVAQVSNSTLCVCFSVSLYGCVCCGSRQRMELLSPSSSQTPSPQSCHLPVPKIYVSNPSSNVSPVCARNLW